MIEVRELSKNYGPYQAVKNLNFKVNKGDVVGFLGPNGAGKSTTMKIITGFMAPSQGSALVGGIDVFENPIEVKKKIGYLPETPPVYGDMYVSDFLTFVAKLKRVPKEKIRNLVDRAVEKTMLGDVKNRLIQNLSKGFRQRVGIAQALVSDPEVLVLDEPTVGLDPKQVAEIRHLIKELKGQHTIILSTHVLPEVQAVCDKVIIINKGQIVAQDSIQNLSQLSAGRSQLLIRLRKDVGNLEAILGDIPGVLNIKAIEGSRSWQLDLKWSEEAVDIVSSRLVEKRLGLIELTPTKADLEDIFLRLTYGASTKAAGQELT